ncbi:OLC1v1012912C1 [Oldenlandia corymbosa var. corymbosa]|uniref:OLC1v1012912C1 n=1 Tax=Oldenlandia corymbosa var. corymbosa TaxID=529605 RepID=A0AAV1DX95_OLDCO|nr:OLC1v1012912C1 [Oldenlandia corymbosa var. corymbosa]
MVDKFAQLSPVDPQKDPYGYLGLVQNPDGLVSRSNENHSNLLVKDVTINQSKNTWARVFLPKEMVYSNPTSKLPVLIYFHAGGFVICSVSTPFFEDLYTTFTTKLNVMLISVDYRLASEHKLPVAYDDCKEALEWIHDSKDEWLTKYADLSNSFLMGSNAGANIAYNVGLSITDDQDNNNLQPLNIKGLILNQPFFGGMKRTDSESKGTDDKMLPPCLSDVMWELALPKGADRDHEFSNPLMDPKSGRFEKIKGLGWKILVTGCDGDPLFDRQVEFVKMLEGKGFVCER